MATMKATPKDELHRAVSVLQDSKGRWARLGVPARIDLLRRCIKATAESADGLVAAANAAKGIAADDPVAAENWLGGPMTTLRNLRLLALVLDEIRKHGRPRLEAKQLSVRADGQVLANVFPRETLDPMMFPKLSAEVWMEPGVARDEVIGGMAWAYQQGEVADTGKVALVLGAGNVASIGPMDVLYKLFVENQVCVLKMNPVNDYTGPYVEKGFQPLIDEGYLRVVYGDSEEGDFLVHHPGVDEIHMTGSDRVHDIIVWGPPGPEQEAAKKAGKPRVSKRFTSELGCVTPVILVPGDWSDAELQFQAENVATMLANNASHNCNAAKVLVTHAGWPQREAFLARLKKVLANVRPRQAYYPGSEGRYQKYVAAHPEAERIGEGAGARLPWTLVAGVDPSKRDDPAFTTEAWCAVLAETGLPASDAVDFLGKATAFANDTLWGTLSCSIVASPKTLAETGVNAAFEKAVSELRFGTVAINQWAALAYGLVWTTWGAFPGHTLEDVRSGIGVVHNALMFHRPQKTVIRGPFTMAPKPPWFVTHKGGGELGKKLTAYEAAPSVTKLPGIAIAAMKG